MTEAFKIEKVFLKEKTVFQVLRIILLDQIEVYKTSQIGYEVITTCNSYEEAEKIIKEILSHNKEDK